MYRSPFIAGAFKIINLLLVVAIAIYVFKKYILNTIKSQISEEELKLSNLERSIKDNKKQAVDIAHDTEVQEKENKILLGKVKGWANLVTEQNKQEESDFEQSLEKAKQRYEVQQKFLEEDLIQQKVTPIVIKQLKADVAAKFASKAEQDKFSKDIINMLRGKA